MIGSSLFAQTFSDQWNMESGSGLVSLVSYTTHVTVPPGGSCGAYNGEHLLGENPPHPRHCRCFPAAAGLVNFGSP